MIIKWIAIWGGKKPDVRGDVVMEIFWQSPPGSFACVAQRRVQLPIATLWIQKSTISFRHNVSLRVKCESIWEDQCRHNVTIVSDLPKHHNVGCVIGFHHYRCILWRQSKSTVVLWVHLLILEENFSHLGKSKACLIGGNAGVCLKVYNTLFPEN